MFWVWLCLEVWLRLLLIGDGAILQGLGGWGGRRGSAHFVKAGKSFRVPWRVGRQGLRKGVLADLAGKWGEVHGAVGDEGHSPLERVGGLRSRNRGPLTCIHRQDKAWESRMQQFPVLTQMMLHCRSGSCPVQGWALRALTQLTTSTAGCQTHSLYPHRACSLWLVYLTAAFLLAFLLPTVHLLVG